MPVLVWEAVDRMTRLPQLLATDLVKRLVRADVAIVFDEADLWIDKKTIEDNWIILQVMIDQAYQYSRRLSRRLKSSWHNRRESGEKFAIRRPAWLTWDKARKEFVPNAGAEAIKFIFEKTAQGVGQRQIVRRLQENFRPSARRGGGIRPDVQKVLADRSVLGERRPCVMGEDGERVPVAQPPIKDYYPAIIDVGLWH